MVAEASSATEATEKADHEGLTSFRVVCMLLNRVLLFLHRDVLSEVREFPYNFLTRKEWDARWSDLNLGLGQDPSTADMVGERQEQDLSQPLASAECCADVLQVQFLVQDLGGFHAVHHEPRAKEWFPPAAFEAAKKSWEYSFLRQKRSAPERAGISRRDLRLMEPAGISMWPLDTIVICK